MRVLMQNLSRVTRLWKSQNFSSNHLAFDIKRRTNANKDIERKASIYFIESLCCQAKVIMETSLFIAR